MSIRPVKRLIKSKPTIEGDDRRMECGQMLTGELIVRYQVSAETCAWENETAGTLPIATS